MIGVRRHLHGELAAGRQRRGPPREHRADDPAPIAGWRWRGRGRRSLVGRVSHVHAPMSPSSNRTPATGVRRGVGEHRRRVVDADHVGDREPLGGLRRQLAGAAAEVDGAAERSVGRDQADEIPERLRPLGGELPVLRGIPVGHTVYV